MTVNRSLLSNLQQYQKIHDKAVQLYALFEDAESSELLRIQKDLADNITELLENTGLGWNQCGNLGRHLTFLGRNLERNDKSSSTYDVRDILFHDLPATLRSMISEAAEEQYLDERLRDAVYPLLEGGHYDSAVRKTFVILTDRLRRAFGITDESDGENLINAVFGNREGIPVALSESDRKSLRNLISGFYGVYRNRYAHNDREAKASDARAVIGMANQILFEIEEIAEASMRDT